MKVNWEDVWDYLVFFVIFVGFIFIGWLMFASLTAEEKNYQKEQREKRAQFSEVCEVALKGRVVNQSDHLALCIRDGEVVYKNEF